jgi:hypothetical protein
LRRVPRTGCDLVAWSQALLLITAAYDTCDPGDVPAGRAMHGSSRAAFRAAKQAGVLVRFAAR